MSGSIFFSSHPSPDHPQTRARAVARGFLSATAVFALVALAGNELAGFANAEVINAGGGNGGAT